jgi:hypothetical protein
MTPGRVLVFVPGNGGTDPEAGQGGTWVVDQPPGQHHAESRPGSAPGKPSADPVFVVCAGRSGSTLLRFLLDAHPDLACPPETRLPTMCAQMASVWLQLAGSPVPKERGDGLPPVPEPALAGIRDTVDLMVGPYLAQRGKRRYCDKSLGAAEHVDVLRAVFPGAKFLCLYRHPMDVIASGIEACPWGLNGFGFDPYADSSPRNSVRALGQFWADNAALILAAEERLGGCAHRVRYEDLVADPESVADGIFRFLGVRPVPGISAACFTPERERLGPGDYKIWHTKEITTSSVGRGWSVPAELIGPPLTATVNDLAGTLGYARIDKSWGIAAVPPDLRQPGTGPGTATEPPAGNGDTPPGLRMMAARLLSGLATLDDQFTQRWQPWSQEVFLVTVTTPGGGAVAARWRVDLATRAVTSASALPPGDTAGSRWDIVGSADVWKQVLDGGANLSVACRNRQLRYCDTGDVAPAVPGLRVAMLGELLGISSWQPPEPGQLEALSPDRAGADIFIR